MAASLTTDQLKALRKRCQRDLYFLGKDVCRRDFEEQPHREMCQFFIEKNPSIPYTEWDTVKQRLLMISRGSFKSSIDVLDCVQATICNPDIRILILTAEKNLAYAFAEEYRNYFTVVEDNPTDFQRLFPEFCVPAGKREKSNEFTTPARKKYKKEPTLWANSIGSNLPGWHCDILKLDDVVNNTNSAEPEQIEKVIKEFNYVRKLVDPGGYIDVIGTPYAPNDLYNYIQKFCDLDSLKVLARPAWILKRASELKPAAALTADDYDLLFPSRLTYDFLKKEQKYDPVTFDSQYLVNPRSSARFVFTEELVRSAVLPWQAIPKKLFYYTAWDLNYKQGINNNFAAGPVVAVDEQGRMYIMDLTWGQFNITDLCFHMADTVRRYPIQISAIEDVNGARWLEPEIERAATRLGVKVPLHWLPVDRNKDAKILRIARLAQLFKERRLFISDACPHIEDIIESFSNFTGSKRGVDDIPDAISFFPRFVNINPAQFLDPAQFAAEYEKLRQQEFYNLVYPQENPIPPPMVELEPEAQEYVNYF